MIGHAHIKSRPAYTILLAMILLMAMLMTACGPNSGTDRPASSDNGTETTTDLPTLTTSETDSTGTDSSETSASETNQSETLPEPTADPDDETTDTTEPVAVWPSEELNGLSEPPGYVTAVIFDDQSKSITVIVDQVLLEEIEDYYLLLQEAHFQLQEKTEDTLHLSMSLLADPFQIQLLYDKNLQQLMLVYSNLSSSEDTDSTGSHTDEPNLVWPEDWTELMIPAGAVVEDVIVYDERDTLVYLGSVSRDKADAYVEMLAALFAQESVVQLGDSSIMYMGENEAGDYVEFFWADDATASIEIIRSGIVPVSEND